MKSAGTDWPSLGSYFAGGDLLRPADTGDAAQMRLWRACELCLFAEYRLHVRADPRRLDEKQFAAWQTRALTPEEGIFDPSQPNFVQPFWIVRGGQTAGIVGLETWPDGWQPFCRIWSLYLFPEQRGRGLGRRLLARIFEAALAAGFDGFCVETRWIFQAAVKFYLAQGLWLQNWQHSLVFCRDRRLPAYRFTLDNDLARLRVAKAGAWRLYYSAERQGQSLRLREPVDDLENRPAALNTFALHLAINGWPLVRGAREWAARFTACASGSPEGLAEKIECFEAYERKHGFKPATAKIPGLAYRDWPAIMGRETESCV